MTPSPEIIKGLTDALTANTAATEQMASVLTVMVDIVPALVVLVVAGLGVIFGRFAGGAI